MYMNCVIMGPIGMNSRARRTVSDAGAITAQFPVEPGHIARAGLEPDGAREVHVIPTTLQQTLRHALRDGALDLVDDVASLRDGCDALILTLRRLLHRVTAVRRPEKKKQKKDERPLLPRLSRFRTNIHVCSKTIVLRRKSFI